MPQNSPQIKKEAVKGYEATVIESSNIIKEREGKASETVTYITQSWFTFTMIEMADIHSMATKSRFDLIMSRSL